MPPKKSSPKKAGSKKSSTSKAAPKKSAPANNLSNGKIKSVEAQQTKIKYLNESYKFSEARNNDLIHPRKIIPKVKAGPKVIDALPTAPLSFEEMVPMAALAEANAALMAPIDTLTLVKNVQLNDLATSDTASHVCEPSVAMNKNVIFYTGNWFAAISTDGGATFKYVNPYSTFPNPPGMQFCCDQVVHYIRSIDMFIWLLQYTADSSGKNIQRIAYATTAKASSGTWKFFDITPASLGLGAGIWLDFPDLADGQNMLYMSTNCFSGNTWKASAIARIALTSFTSGVLSASRTLSTTHFSFRVAQNCGTTAYFVAHNTTSSLRVFSWKESSPTPTFKDVTVATWSAGPYSSVTPDGRNWLERADRRHTGATMAGNELWFAWASAKGGVNARPQPFVQIARINALTMTLIENINLWDPNSAICYAALATNINNEVGVSYMLGGGPKFPTHVVGILTGTRRQVTTFVSKRGPADNKWGDYLCIRRNHPNQKLFCASGYTLQTGSSSTDSTANFTLFGRSGEV